MKKIKSLFMRNYETDRLVRNEVVKGTEWVMTSEGIATEKINGTACMIKDNALYKRYDCKHGKTPPVNFVEADEPDPVSRHWPGWVPVADVPQDKWHRSVDISSLSYGTYELVGPKVQGNSYKLKTHRLVKHGEHVLEVPRTFEGIKRFFTQVKVEGIVWHRKNGDMVKIKARDFGFKYEFVDSYIYES